ncbi:MAG: type II toxin-antitoxin system PemK/MazF family toxin [Planctomycetota bacterium]|nr:type II toxin-antitoxin system PemK/MazF family toxin [Planctomycetota bacterium]
MSLDPTQGAEITKTRPCVVLTHDTLNQLRRTVVVIPLSTAAKPHPPITVPVTCQGQSARIICPICALSSTYNASPGPLATTRSPPSCFSSRIGNQRHLSCRAANCAGGTSFSSLRYPANSSAGTTNSCLGLAWANALLGANGAIRNSIALAAPAEPNCVAGGTARETSRSL